jgi:hypothetical protein
LQLEIKSPELEALIAKRLECGGLQDIEDVLLEALKPRIRSEQSDANGLKRDPARRSLAALFADSPFKGLDLRFEREEDTGRDIRL